MKNTTLNTDNFNYTKFVYEFKKKTELSIMTCKLKKANNDKKAISNYHIIYKLIRSLVKTPIIYNNEMIYIVIIEVTSFLDYIKAFKNSIQNVNSQDGFNIRHENYFERQELLISHLIELNNNPTEVPSFVKDQI